MTGYSPLGCPSTYRPDAKDSDPSLLDHPLIKEFAEKYKKTTAQILIRYQLDRGLVVIPKSITKSRIVGNFDVFDFELSSKDVETINGLNINYRFVSFPS